MALLSVSIVGGNRTSSRDKDEEAISDELRGDMQQEVCVNDRT